MKLISDRSLIQSVMLMSTRIPPKISKDGGPKYGSKVGSSPMARLDVAERLPRRFCLGICKAPVMSSPNGHM